ncbi:GNAT family N-acetyltransferase [Lacticaseibacillus kribbianus]|uniref:GNAT family N-acetyltransferase n=1 Tax=Lacticaseibacillus kribbianus TaxID=2926292 RepID=UPI001CD7A777|nr:GNAT family N-acetyltransferase [Lacticaseibacillus kribbianus]
MTVTVRRFAAQDAAAVAAMVARTLRISNAADYPADYLEADIARLTPAFFVASAAVRHLYVAESAAGIVGCAAIGPFWDVPHEYSLFNVFVDPATQGQGIGRRLMAALEQDAFYQDAVRVEIPASITAVPFYRKFGYGYKDGVTAPDSERLLRLEKFPHH